MKNDVISLSELIDRLKFMQTYRLQKINKGEVDLRNKINMKLLMSCRDYKISYFTGNNNELTIDIAKKMYGYSVMQPRTGVYYENHCINYDIKTKEIYCDDDDKLAKYIIRLNKKELGTIFNSILKFEFLNKNVYYDTYNNGKIEVSLKGNVQCDSKKDINELNSIYVPVEELPLSFTNSINYFSKKR